MNKKKPVVSIFMLTYNQKDFIGQAIEAVLEQRGDFSYELVIGDDGSTDGTLEICKYYKEKYNNKIKLLSSNRNLGLIQNFIRTYKECNGKYVAICDGDDYWTDPLKLQKQVSFLEENPDFGIVFTSFKFLFPDGSLMERDYSNQKSITTFEDLIHGNYISSVTALFRNKQTSNDFPDWLDNCPYGDWPLYLWTTAHNEKIKFLNDITAVYRREIGVSEKMKAEPISIATANRNIVAQVYKDFHFSKNKKVTEKSLLDHEFALMSNYLRAGKKYKAMCSIIILGINKPIRLLRTLFYLGKLEITK